MTKEDFLQPFVEDALTKIHFVERYQNIAIRFKERNEAFKYDNNGIIDIAQSVNIPLMYSKAKEFYWQDKRGAFILGFGFTIRFNSFDFGLSVKNEELKIFSAAPWDFLVDLITDNSVKIPRVAFRNYDDVKAILAEVFSICEDLKKQLVEQI